MEGTTSHNPRVLQVLGASRECDSDPKDLRLVWAPSACTFLFFPKNNHQRVLTAKPGNVLLINSGKPFPINLKHLTHHEVSEDIAVCVDMPLVEFTSIILY